MAINAAELPSLVLSVIFSYLDLPSLGRAAQTCRSWNIAQKTDSLWKNLCLPILDLQTPLQASWKEQYRILHRWKTGNFKEISLPTILKILPESGDFTVLEDGTAIGVIPLDWTTPFLYSVRNLVSGEELKTIDVTCWGCGQIVDSELQGTIWTIVDERARIFQFDVCRGACINRFRGDFELGRSLHLHCSDQEIVVAAGNRVQIWDAQQRTLRHAFEVVAIQEISVARITPNYIICFCKSWLKGSEFILAVNKQDPSRQIKIEANVELYSLESCGAYFAFLAKGGELHVYEDSFDAQIKLKRILRVVDEPTPWPGSVQMYRNWVAVSKNEIFRVFDVRTGYEVSLPVKEKGYEFRINAQKTNLAQRIRNPNSLFFNQFMQNS